MIITSVCQRKRHSSCNKQVNKKSETICDMLEMTCHICASLYDAVEHTPMSICPQEHIYCSKCIADIFSHQPRGTRCPTCRAYIHQAGTKVNKTLLRLCELIPKVAFRYGNLEDEKHQLENKVAKLQNELQSRENDEVEKNKQNIDKNKEKKDQFNGFPIINPSQLINKSKKVNIHSYVARRRRMQSATSRKDNDIKIDQVNLMKKLI